MKVAFTICSNNYIAKAKVVADTFTSNHPNYRFFIFLVDLFDEKLNYESLENYEIVEIHTVVADIEELAKKYNIVELNTAVKPLVFLKLFNDYKATTVIYLDPDLVIYGRFIEIEDLLDSAGYNVVITPHWCSPIDDGKVPSEIHLSRYGLYNLGFIAVENSVESIRFLLWWHKRLMKYCFILPEKGMFTDQVWVNYAPIYFEKVKVLKHHGYNVANWNLYERRISKKGNTYFINDNEELKFFHFSQYQFSNPYIISTQQNRHTIEERPDVKELIDLYQAQLIDNQQEVFSQSPCYYHQLYQTHNNIKTIRHPKLHSFKKKLRNKAVYLITSMLRLKS